MKLLGVMNGGFDITDQLLIGYFAFVRYWRKDGSTIRQYIIIHSFKKAYDSARKVVLHNILIQFGVPMKLVRLIECVQIKHIATSV
jgi:hypothetical protein